MTSKRKSEESLERASKRSRTSQSPSNSSNQTFSGPSSSSLVTGCKRTSIKRKSTDDESEERPRKRSKGTPSPSEDPNHQTTSEASTSNKPGTSSSVNTGPPCSRAAFEARYEEEERLGRGGFGTVFAGHRKYNNLLSVSELSSTLKPHLLHLLLSKLPELTESVDAPPGCNHQILFIFWMQDHGVTS